MITKVVGFICSEVVVVGRPLVKDRSEGGQIAIFFYYYTVLILWSLMQNNA